MYDLVYRSSVVISGMIGFVVAFLFMVYIKTNTHNILLIPISCFVTGMAICIIVWGASKKREMKNND